MPVDGTYRRLVLSLLIASTFFLLIPKPLLAYTTNMNASVVLGQSSFTTGSSGTTATTLNGPRGVKVCDGKLVVADSSNNRVLIWDTLPISNGRAPDLVLGQADFTSVSPNRGGSVAANTLSGGWGIECRGGKLFVADNGNIRVLIWNTFPTQNGQPADVVVGQANMAVSASHNGNDLDKLEAPVGVATDGTKLAVLDSTNQRILIWNSIPTTNGVSADITLGTMGEQACTSSTLSSSSQNILIDKGKLFWAATFPPHGHRVLIWNSIPTTNNQPANVVVGQPDFTTCTANTGTANGLSNPFDIATDPQGRFMIVDRGSQRVLIFNYVPTSNGASADLVLGQPSFSGTSINQGQSSPGANTFSGARGVAVTDNKIIVSDGDNNRVLVFDNIVNSPSLSLGTPQGRDNGIVRLTGNANVSSLYNVRSVEYQVNGGGTSGATATDGSFNSSNEDFYFDFDPKVNGNTNPGYAVKVSSQNTNMDTTDNLFFFLPFDLNGPADKTTTTSAYPTFDFSVNKQRQFLKENLSKYLIQTKPTGSSSWTTLIDDISPDHDDGTVETDKYVATYSDSSSRISVHSKTNKISGSVSWRVVAVDKSGHSEETGARTLSSSATSSFFSGSHFFPLVLTKVTSNKLNYTGIAFANSMITLNLTDVATATMKTYTVITNTSSRFSLTIPRQDIKTGRKYQVDLSVSKDDKYNQLPTITFIIASPVVSNVQGTSTSVAVPITMEPTPVPDVTVVPPVPTPTLKHCFWGICF